MANLTALEQNIKARFADDYFGDRAQGEGRNTDMFRQAISDVGHLLAVVDGLRREVSTVAKAGGAALQQLHDAAQREVIPSNECCKRTALRIEARLDALRDALQKVCAHSGVGSVVYQIAAGALVGETAARLERPVAETKEEPSLTLNGYQLKEALEFVAPDNDADQLETDVTIQWGEGHCGPGHYACLTEYPDEGSILLAGDPPESPVKSKTEYGANCSLHPGAMFKPSDGCPTCEVGGAPYALDATGHIPSASTGDVSPPTPSPSPVECPKCRTQLAFEGDVCGLCQEDV